MSLLFPPRHVHLRPLPGPRRLLPGGVQPLRPGGQAAGLREALRAEARSAGQAVCATALSHPGPTAPAETPPWPLPFPWDQRHLGFLLGGAEPGEWAATCNPALSLHPAPVQTLQELQGRSTVRRHQERRVRGLQLIGELDDKMGKMKSEGG